MAEKPREIPKELLPKWLRDQRWCPMGHMTPYAICPLHSIETIPNIRVYVEPK